MRVVKYLFTTLFSIVLIGGIGFFLTREGLLLLASRRVVDSLEVLKLYAQRDTARTECRELAGGEATETPVTYQLRFLSSNEYILEAVCPLTQSNPIELGRNMLPMYVAKTPGKSGFVWADGTTTGIELEVFTDLAEFVNDFSYKNIDPNLITRNKTIVVENKVIETGAALPETPGPTTSCEGFGYTCCDPITQVGAGDQLIGLNQCANNCYSQCISRPVILSFASNPFFDVKTRQVEVTAGNSLTFSFVADKKGAENLTATIDFGDGERESVSGTEGKVAHTYECPDSFCIYEASITATDENNLTSVNTAVSKLTVQVNR